MTTSLVLEIFASLRPRQWLKNLVVFAAIMFSSQLFIFDKFLPVFFTFIIFSAASSSMYLVNDVVDRSEDRLHFSKRKRPIATGSVSPKIALTTALILSVFTLVASYQLQDYLFLVVLIYLLIQLIYTLFLKGIIILDVLTIAFAFMLRLFAGSFVILAPLSSWLILTTMMLALFLGIGKRRSELTILGLESKAQHRKTLLYYPSILLDGLVFMMGTATLITYSLFTFNSPEAQGKEFFAALLPSTLAKPKLLMVTIPVVVYGIFRYLYLIFEKKEGESPEKILLSDRPLFFSVLLWFVTIVFLLYFSTF